MIVDEQDKGVRHLRTKN